MPTQTRKIGGSTRLGASIGPRLGTAAGWATGISAPALRCRQVFRATSRLRTPAPTRRARAWYASGAGSRGGSRVAEARLEPTSPTNLRFTASIEAYVNGQRRWGWPENGTLHQRFHNGHLGRVQRLSERWNSGTSTPTRFGLSSGLGHSGNLANWVPVGLLIWTIATALA